jgi:hypothetical protein
MKHLEVEYREYAILFYGHCWKTREVTFDFDEDTWPVVMLKRRGHKDPFDGKPVKDGAVSDNDYKAIWEAWRDANWESLASWQEKRRAIRQELGVEVSSHGSVEQSFLCVHIAKAFDSASRCYPQLVRPEIKPEWNGMLRRWFDEMGLEPPVGQLPNWWLVTWWG